MTKQITPNLWFDGNAKEAVDFYVSVFPGSKIISTSYYPNSEAEGLADFQKELAGDVLTIEFELSGNRFVAINAGSEFKFNEAVSFSIPCEDQAEIDYYWQRLSTVPESEQCGWCKDQYGLSWQVAKPRNTGHTARKDHLEAEWQTPPPMLLQPGSLHRAISYEGRSIDGAG